MRPAGAATRIGGPGLREGGFALLLVLWSLALLALIGTQVAATGRAEALLAANLRTAAMAEAAADGAVHQAVFHLLAPPGQRWPADGLAREVALPGSATALLRVESEQGKLNPNLASAPVLAALLQQLGAEPRAATGLAAAILDWRSAGLRPRPGGAKEPQYRAAGRDYGPPGRPFESIAELGLVLGMTPALLARLSPFLSIHQGRSPTPALPPRRCCALRTAQGAEEELAADPDAAPVVAITAAVALPGGARFARRAVVRLGPGGRGRGWQVLEWGVPETGA
ncbi:general secretion pathway protein GspK [Dankookia sp. P2]|uniref:general secretion pathway protein GspK n=1 Tax=Dankookia sp. P2 TaxID=3423955 RepID=UPI003D669D24